MSETTAYLPVICAAMKLMVACQRAETDDLLTTEPGLIPIREALREMEAVFGRVESKGHRAPELPEPVVPHLYVTKGL
jgi:hypothetical protein